MPQDSWKIYEDLLFGRISETEKRERFPIAAVGEDSIGDYLSCRDLLDSAYNLHKGQEIIICDDLLNLKGKRTVVNKTSNLGVTIDNPIAVKKGDLIFDSSFTSFRKKGENL